jgi:hypothetical protein
MWICWRPGYQSTSDLSTIEPCVQSMLKFMTKMYLEPLAVGEQLHFLFCFKILQFVESKLFQHAEIKVALIVFFFCFFFSLQK